MNSAILKRALPASGILALALMASGPAAAQFGGPPPPPNTGVPLFTELTGNDAHGYATVVIDPPKGTACYIVNVTGLGEITGPATAAHVHIGGPGENGRPVIPLAAPTDGSSGGCVPIAADVAQAILANPGGYYVNVHTQAFPQGAIRGQLKS